MGWALLAVLALAIVVCLVIGVQALGEFVGLLMDAAFPDDD